MTLDDLGRAAWEAEWDQLFGNGYKLLPKWERMNDSNRRVVCASALAAVERFAEALVDDVLYFDELHPKEKIRQLLSSLRDEANTIAAKQQKGS